MKLIFLDIDGVLNDEDFYRLRSTEGSELYNEFRNKPYPLSDFDPRCVEQLNRIINETDAKIVLSSSWRLDSNESLLNIFNKVGIPDFIDKTPFISSGVGLRGMRGEEIDCFLNSYDYKNIVENYVILDDDNDMLDTQTEHFVHLNDLHGLTKEDADKAIKILNN